MEYCVIKSMSNIYKETFEMEVAKKDVKRFVDVSNDF